MRGQSLVKPPPRRLSPSRTRPDVLLQQHAAELGQGAGRWIVEHPDDRFALEEWHGGGGWLRTAQAGTDQGRRLYPRKSLFGLHAKPGLGAAPFGSLGSSPCSWKKVDHVCVLAVLGSSGIRFKPRIGTR